MRIGNKEITTPIIDIVKRIRQETGYYRDIKQSTNDIAVTCPFHKDGRENHPSCYVLTKDLDGLPAGFHHCFTCGISVPFETAITHIYNTDGKEWLKDNYADIFIEEKELLPEINLGRDKTEYLDESILKNYDYYHDYMWARKLSKEVVDKFKVGYDPNSKCLTFPVWDIHNNLVMITKRNVYDKKFYIDKNKEKPVYLLNFLLGEKKLYVCESQINALYLNSLGYPAVGLIGTGTSAQHDILKHCGVRNFILCFDGDEAGKHGAERFKKSVGEECMITEIQLPKGKDINDLSPEEVKILLQNT